MLAALQEALVTMEAALHLLDQAEAPAEIGAHLDLAICKLQKVIGVQPDRSGKTAVAAVAQ